MPSAGDDEDVRRVPRRRLCVCTRIHQNNADRPVDLVKVCPAVREKAAFHISNVSLSQGCGGVFMHA